MAEPRVEEQMAGLHPGNIGRSWGMIDATSMMSGCSVIRAQLQSQLARVMMVSGELKDCSTHHQHQRDPPVLEGFPAGVMQSLCIRLQKRAVSDRLVAP